MQSISFIPNDFLRESSRRANSWASLTLCLQLLNLEECISKCGSERLLVACRDLSITFSLLSGTEEVKYRNARLSHSILYTDPFILPRHQANCAICIYAMRLVEDYRRIISVKVLSKYLPCCSNTYKFLIFHIKSMVLIPLYHSPQIPNLCSTRYLVSTGYNDTSKIKHSLCACTVDYPRV